MSRLVIFMSMLVLFSVKGNTIIFAQSSQVNALTFNPDDILGVWSNSDKIMNVKIEKIGSHYFGKLIWLEKPNEPNGSPKLDKNNPDPTLRRVPFIGLRVMRDIKYRGEGVWGGGSLYDPEKGKTYGCKIMMDVKNEVKIRGYIGLTLLGKSEKFYRISN